jgi:endoglucanase
VSHWRGIAAAVVAAALGIAAYGALLGGSAPAAGSAAGAGYIRVNQVGYPLSADKRAYLMAGVPAARAQFTVTDEDGRVVAAGTVGPDLGRWSRRYPHVYPIDFTRVRRAGTYAVSVGGPAPAQSVARVGAGSALYAGPIRNALSFYRVQRDGADIVRSALRTAPSHLNDADAMTYRTPKVDGDGAFKGDLSPLGVRIDASGGWWDAGDYLKFLHATAYTDAVLLMGVRDFPDQMGARAGPADFGAEARFGARWLLRMWDDRTRTLYYQVGIGNGNDAIVSDHDIWRLPQDDDTYGGHDPAFRYIRHRPVFRAGPPGSPVSPNLAGRDAAALALCYQVYRTTDRGLARNCLVSAEHLFDLADTAPKGHLTTAIPFDFYPESEWRDDLELGAAELALALEEPGAPRGLPPTSTARTTPPTP